MTDPFARLRRFLRELKRRNVYQVAVTYAVVGFVLIQVADLTFVRLGLPSWTVTLVIVLVAMGFPLALVLAWAFERTPEGVRRTAEADGAPEPESMSRKERRAQSRLAMKTLVGLGLVGAAVAGGWYLMGGGGESREVREQTVAVLPFQVSGSGTEEWREGMVTMLGTGLDGAAGLRAIADQTVLAAWTQAGQATGPSDDPRFLSAARRVGARYAVVGSAVKLGGELRLTADVHAAPSGDRLGQVEVRGSPDRVTALTDSLTRRILGVLLEESGEGLPSVDLASITTSSLPALKSYLRGEQHFRAGEYESALRNYQAAVQEDTAFALAYSRLATARSMVAGAVAADPRSIRRAHELSDRLPRRERRLVGAQYTWVVDRRPLAATDSLRRWTEVYPDDPSVWAAFGEVLWHNAVPGGWSEADRAFERAVELDSGVAIYHLHLVNLAFSVHNDSALAARRIEAQPSASARRLNQLSLKLAFGSNEARREAIARLDTMPPVFEGFPFWQVLANLQHPRTLGLLERVLHRLRERDDLDFGDYSEPLMEITLRRGRIAETLRLAKDLGMSPTARGCLWAESMTLGYPVPDSVAGTLLEPSRLGDDASVERLRCSGLYLIETHRSEELPRVVRRLEERVPEKPDSESRAWTEARRAIRQLEGYRAWRAGDLDRAEERWSGWKEPGLFAQHGALWRGDLYRRLDQRGRAEGWYRAAWPHPVAHERLGQLHEEMGRADDAAAAYRRFIAAWQDADEELQPRVEEARKRLERLTAPEAEPND